MPCWAYEERGAGARRAPAPRSLALRPSYDPTTHGFVTLRSGAGPVRNQTRSTQTFFLSTTFTTTLESGALKNRLVTEKKPFLLNLIL